MRADERRARAGAGAEHAAVASGPADRRARPGDELPDGLRRQHAGDRRSHGNPPPRRCRCHDRRRRALDDPSVRRHRLQPPDRPLHRQRKSAARQPAVRRPARRIRSRRRRGHGDPGNARSRQGAQRDDPGRGRRLRLHRRCLSHHRSAPRRRRRHRRHAGSPGRRRTDARGHSTTSTPTAPARAKTTATKPARSNPSSASAPAAARSAASRA